MLKRERGVGRAILRDYSLRDEVLIDPLKLVLMRPSLVRSFVGSPLDDKSNQIQAFHTLLSPWPSEIFIVPSNSVRVFCPGTIAGHVLGHLVPA
jgi:hypothetical protein